jgi:hypothetical protein
LLAEVLHRAKSARVRRRAPEMPDETVNYVEIPCLFKFLSALPRAF